MKLSTLTAAAALLLLAAPAHAYPQWLPLPSDPEVFINYNSVRVNAAGIRSVDVTRMGAAATYHIDCIKWRGAATVNGETTGWDPIPRGSLHSQAAYIICPGPRQKDSIKAAQGY